MKRTCISALTATLVIVGCMAFLSGCTAKENSDSAQEQKDTASTMNMHVNSDVTAFADYVNDGKNSMGLDHAYTSEALSKLAKAVESKGSETGYTIQEDMGKVKECADKITRDPNVTTHANDIRKAADILSTSLKNMQLAKYTQLGSEADDLKKASASIDPAILTLKQKDAVQSFFSKAASLLQKMN